MKNNFLSQVLVLAVFLLILQPNCFSHEEHNSLQRVKVASGDSIGAPTIDGTMEEGEYPNLLEDPEKGIQFSWYNDSSYLWCGVRVSVKGWVAVGFDPEKYMEGANFVLGYVSKGSTLVRDDYGTGMFSHKPDMQLKSKKADTVNGQNNVLEYKGTQTDGWTTLEFKIPLNSGDKYDKTLKVKKEYIVLISASDKDDFGVKHNVKAIGNINLK